MAEKKKFPKFTAPRGVFKWPKLSEPDFGNEKFPKPDGEYSVTVVYQADDPAVQKLIAQVQPLHDEAVKDAKEQFKKLDVGQRKKLKDVTVNDLFKTVYDNETEEPTGEIEFKFAMGASGVIKNGPRKGKEWSARPDLFDAKGRPILGVVQRHEDGTPKKDKLGKPVLKFPAIWGGSEGKISFEAGSYFIAGSGLAGVKLRLVAAQIIDLVQNGSRTASQYGFGEEEGYGYDANAEQEDTETTRSGDGEDDLDAAPGGDDADSPTDF